MAISNHAVVPWRPLELSLAAKAMNSGEGSYLTIIYQDNGSRFSAHVPENINLENEAFSKNTWGSTIWNTNYLDLPTQVLYIRYTTVPKVALLWKSCCPLKNIRPGGRIAGAVAMKPLIVDNQEEISERMQPFSCLLYTSFWHWRRMSFGIFPLGQGKNQSCDNDKAPAPAKVTW